MVQGWFVFVRVSVCLCVCPSLRKSAVTFEPLDESAQNFQGPLYSSQLIFVRVTRTPGPAGSGRGPRGQAGTPKKRVSAKSISSGGVGAGGSCRTFSESGQRGEQNVGSGIFSFGPRLEKTGPEGGAGREADQNFGISIFLIKGTPAKIRCWSLFVLCNFLIRRTSRAPRVPLGPGGVKIKSHNWGILYRRDPP